MAVLLGTCGWSYQEWVGLFYPNNKVAKSAVLRQGLWHGRSRLVVLQDAFKIYGGRMGQGDRPFFQVFTETAKDDNARQAPGRHRARF